MASHCAYYANSLPLSKNQRRPDFQHFNIKKKIIVNSGRSSPQYFTDQHLTLSSTVMYLFISSQFENHTIGFSQSSGLSTIMEFPFSSALLLLLTLLCLLDIGEVSFNVDELFIFFSHIIGPKLLFLQLNF